MILQGEENFIVKQDYRDFMAAFDMGNMPEIEQARSLTVGDLVRKGARVFGDQDAIVSPKRRVTFEELETRTNQIANALLDNGMEPGDTIAVISEPRPEFAEVYYAGAKAGITVAALHSRAEGETLNHCLSLSEANAIFVSETVGAPIAEIEDELPKLEEIIQISNSSGGGEYESFIKGHSTSDPSISVADNDIFNVLFTSGTTGKPKGVAISHEATIFRALRIAHHLELKEQSGFLGWLPLYHCGGEESMHATLFSGGKYVTMPEPDIEQMYELVEEEELTNTLLLPGVLQPFVNHPKRDEYDLTSFQATGGYANLISPDTLQELMDITEAPYMDALGMTESSWNLACGTFINLGDEIDEYPKQESLFIDIRVVDEDSNQVPPGKRGELVARGPTVMSGYVKNQEENEKAFQDGWLHTGDVVVRNEDGTLRFVDRKKRIIKSGGENIPAGEIEEALRTHPEVEEVSVIGVSDEQWGEAVKAVVSPVEGKESIDRRELDKHMKEIVANYKRPRFYEFVSPEDLPRSSTGKLQAHKLEERPVTDDQRVPE
ncbi:class I adenylate-forming enzyme family protein [Halorubrum amylolyticum]|uniref:class I adenylate-forming enzyme family protein n=1 Tax=Halorubrum amylolyticum TaxID=2508724 RepID=UPI001F514729|nr:AMP-binding protein [Halorubrum amylolyticum]